ncbi:MAG: YebC/PmpR family DNA-binding transcriptional regulator [Phycisphaerales bacterium]|nr:YebC/PmpR family DNA-binding transcriptional regulator [Phycisphaerales bacterium]
MAGHSAWKNIKHRKASVDAKRGKIWSKASRAIIVAARTGGADIRFNSTLRLAIDDAKAVNMPRDTIEKAVKKGSGDLGGEEFQAIRYEGYGPGGVAVIAEVLTSNINRTAPEIRMIFDKNGGNLGVPGSVSFGFVHAGVILIDRAAAKEDRLVEVALEAGADDVLEEDEVWQVTSRSAVLPVVRDAIEAAGIAVIEAQVMWVASSTVDIDSERAAEITRLVDALEENDDVQRVFTNANFLE